MITFEELKAEVLENPEVRAEYERLRPEFELEATIFAYQTAISVYVTNIELWKAYARAQLELEDEKMQERINRFMERGKIWAEGGENYVAECQKKLNAYAAKMEVWTADVRAKSEELDRAAASLTFEGENKLLFPLGIGVVWRL